MPNISMSDEQRELRRDLVSVANRVEQRLQAIRQRLDECTLAKQDKELRERLEQDWYPRLQEIEKLVKEMKFKCDRRQSLVVVGKRGQGKSTLIQSWIGSGIRRESDSDPLPLPTGVDETTCALVRITSPDALDTEMLKITLLPENALSMVKERPPRPTGVKADETILLSRRSAEPDINPFWVMRYPFEGRDEHVYAKKQDGYYQLGRNGSVPLPNLQYHAAEIIVPLSPEELTGHTEQLLQVVDIVDAPGADPAGRGAFPDWMRNKNKEVFKLGAERVDLLLLVCSIQTAAIHLGGQMQEEILEPWRQRCQGRTQGRMAIVITHAADLFHEVQNGLSRGWSAEHSPTRKIVTNILEQLERLGFLEVDGDLKQWPPVFFVENNRTELRPYQEGWISDPQREHRLRSLLDQDSASWGQLPLGEQCILQIASDWQKEYQDNWPKDKIVQLQHWTIHTLCRLLDDNDRGLHLLTEFIKDWAENGPVAANYWNERITCYQQLYDKFSKLLEALNEPDFHTTLRQVEQAQKWLRKRWDGEGIVWRLGEQCRQRLEQAKINSGPNRSQYKRFSFDEALNDLVNDVLVQLEERYHRGRRSTTSSTHHAEQDESGLENARIILNQCLSCDYPILELRKRYEKLVCDDPESLARIQAFGLERITRIIYYLSRAYEHQLREVLRHCYKRDLSQNTLIRNIYKELVQPYQDEDNKLLESIEKRCKRFLEELQKQRYRRPYNIN